MTSVQKSSAYMHCAFKLFDLQDSVAFMPFDTKSTESRLEGPWRGSSGVASSFLVSTSPTGRLRIGCLAM